MTYGIAIPYGSDVPYGAEAVALGVTVSFTSGVLLGMGALALGSLTGNGSKTNGFCCSDRGVMTIAVQYHIPIPA